MKILALDFDGVIADSQFECLVVGFNAYLKLHKNTGLFGGKNITLGKYSKIKKKHKKIIDWYKKLRPYVIDAFCFYVISHIMENNIKIKDQAQYAQLREK